MNQNNQITKSPWILCQSKSTPGKFYYFNVLTGVQAWCEDYERVRNEQRARQNTNIPQSHTIPYKAAINKSRRTDYSDKHFTSSNRIPDTYDTPTSSYRNLIYPHSPPRITQANPNVHKKEETANAYKIPLISQQKPSNPNQNFRLTMPGPSNNFDRSMASQENPQTNKELSYRPIFVSNSQEHRQKSTEFDNTNHFVKPNKVFDCDRNTYEKYPQVRQPTFSPNLIDDNLNFSSKNPKTQIEENLEPKNSDLYQDLNTNPKYTLKITVDNHPIENNQNIIDPEKIITPSSSCQQPFSSSNVANSNQTVATHNTNNYSQGSTPNPYRTAAPIFGQAVFPRYVSNESVGNIVWTPIQVPTVIVQNHQEMNTNRKIDRHTQTLQSNVKSIVEACDIPLSKRFAANTNICSGISTNDDYILNRSQIFYHDEQRGLSKKLFSSNEQLPGLKVNALPKRVRFKSESNKYNNDTSIHKTSSLESLDFNKLQLRNSKPNDLEKSKSVTTISSLESNDLRFLIMAKKKKNLDLNDLGKKIKTFKDDQLVIDKAKKRVTFDIRDDSYGSDSSDAEYEDDINNEFNKTPYDTLNLQAGLLYVLVEPNTLIDDFEAIDKYIQSENNRRLLVTLRLKSDIEAMCFGGCGGQQRVIAARRITRVFLTPPPYYVSVNGINNLLNIKYDADILSCCVYLISQGHEVVLIANDTNICSKAKTFNVRCMKTCELKNIIRKPKPDITFDLKKIKLCVQNDFNKDTVDSEMNDTSHILDNKNSNLSSEHTEKSHPIKTVDANTSPVNIFIDSTDKVKDKELLNYETTCLNMGMDIQNLYTNDYNGQEKVVDNHKQNEFSNENRNTRRFGLHFDKQNTQSIFDITKEKRPHVENNKSIFENHKTQTFEIRNSSVDSKKYYNEVKIRKAQSIFDIQNTSNSAAQNPQSVDIQASNNLTTGNQSQNISNKVDTRTPQLESQSNPQSVFDIENPLTQQQRANIGETFCLDYYLGNYCVKNDLMYETIRVRFDEWVCSFSQVIEDALTQILAKHKIFTINQTPLELLHELIYKVEKLYYSNTDLKLITDKFLCLYAKECDRKGKLNSSMKPDSFIQLFGCGIILIQVLKEINPTYEELFDAEKSLSDILRGMEGPNRGHESPRFETPTLDRIEINFEKEMKTRSNFVKKRSDVIKYLKAHFEDWNSFTEESQPIDSAQNEVKIIRTVGRNINLLKLDNKSITIKNPTDTTKPGNTDSEKAKNVAITQNNCVIGNKEVLNLDALDFDEMCSNITELSADVDLQNHESNEKNRSDMSLETASFVYDIKISKNKLTSHGIFNVSNAKTANDDSTIDSGIGNESIQAHSLVKMFLTEISGSFKAVHAFIDNCITQLRKDEIREDKKSLLRHRANETHENVACIIQGLKNIIQREANERTAVKEILLKAGLEASTDKKITRYRQVVTKCLEQAQILESALKTILNVTDGDCHMSISSDSFNSNLRYFNIFE